jgi:transposase-like protein
LAYKVFILRVAIFTSDSRARDPLHFRGIEVSHETIRQWGLKFGREFANIIQRRLPRPGDMSASHNRPERIGALRPR